MIINQYELIAKRCPSCDSLVMAKPVYESGVVKYSDYRCSSCSWKSPASID